jgi:hypothetical protein
MVRLTTRPLDPWEERNYLCPFARRYGMSHSQSESFAKDNSSLFKTLACHRVQTQLSCFRIYEHKLLCFPWTFIESLRDQSGKSLVQTGIKHQLDCDAIQSIAWRISHITTLQQTCTLKERNSITCFNGRTASFTCLILMYYLIYC